MRYSLAGGREGMVTSGIIFDRRNNDVSPGWRCNASDQYGTTHGRLVRLAALILRHSRKWRLIIFNRNYDMAIIDAGNLVRRETELYRDTSVFSMQDHIEAMACFDIQELLAKGIRAFEAICSFDEWYREGVFSGKIKYEAEHEEFVKDLYRVWSEPCKEVLSKLEKVKRDGFRPDHEEAFRACCLEVQGILTDDATFFAHNELVELRDAALDQHARGETNEWAL